MTHSLQEGQGKRLQKLLIELDISPYKFSKDLGYKSPDTIYHIINGYNGMSNSFLKRVEESEHCINIEWLLTGLGEAINKKMKFKGYGSELCSDSKIIYPSELDFYFLKRLSQGFASVLNIEEKSYSISIRTSLNSGIEFYFKTFMIDSENILPDNYYVLILQPDWKISSFFDFWRVQEPSIRCQNLLELYEDASQRFENKTFEVYKDIEKLIKNKQYKYLPEKFLKDGDSFVELYLTDSRLK